MKHLPSTVLAGLLASVIAAASATAFAASTAGDQPQCGDEKKGEKDEKDEKPKSPSGI